MAGRKLGPKDLVTIKKGKKTSRVFPESVPAWEKVGWRVDKGQELPPLPQTDDANKSE